MLDLLSRVVHTTPMHKNNAHTPHTTSLYARITYVPGVGSIPAIVDTTLHPDVPIYAPGARMVHSDSMSGDENVVVVAGPLQVTTSDGVYYLVRFAEDNAAWLCFPEDLRPR